MPTLPMVGSTASRFVRGERLSPQDIRKKRREERRRDEWTRGRRKTGRLGDWETGGVQIRDLWYETEKQGRWTGRLGDWETGGVAEGWDVVWE
jgi:hypothetical protein